jgi:hypothetical protein
MTLFIPWNFIGTTRLKSLTFIITDSLDKIHLVKLRVPHLVKKFLTPHGTMGFIAVFTTARHCTLF